MGYYREFALFLRALPWWKRLGVWVFNVGGISWGSVAPFLDAYRGHVIWLYLLWLSLTLFLWSVTFIAGQGAWERLRGERDELKRRLAPKLEVVFAEGPPFEMGLTTQNPVVHWQRFRVGVRNDSGATINHIGVDLVGIHPKSLERVIQLPLPLLPMHELQTPVDPGQRRMFDVVHRGYYPQVPHPSFQGNGDTIEICHAVEHLAPLRVPLQSLELTLQAHGANVPSRLRKVAVGYDVGAGRHGPLSFSLLPTPQ